MLDILHNGVTKKVNGSLKETEGLLIISGKPKWTSLNGGSVYGAIFVDPRIKPTHTVQSIKATTESLQSTTTTDLDVNMTNAGVGMISITVDDGMIVQNNPVVTITMYDIAAVATPSGMQMEITDAEVTFTDWNVVQIYDDDPSAFSGTVAVKIEDDGVSAPSLATVVNNTFNLMSSGAKAFVNAHEIREILPDGRLVCNVRVDMQNQEEGEDPAFPASASNADIHYLYIASDSVRMTLPEVDAEWIEQEGSSVEDHGVIFYEATFAAVLPGNAHLSDVIVVYGENGEKFPETGMLEEDRPKMYSYVTRTEGGAASIVVHWTRDTMPETTKLIAEVYAANYEPANASAGREPIAP